MLGAGRAIFWCPVMLSGGQFLPLIIGGSSSVAAKILAKFLGPLFIPLVSSIQMFNETKKKIFCIRLEKNSEKLELQNIVCVCVLDELHGQLSLLKWQAPVSHFLQDHAQWHLPSQSHCAACDKIQLDLDRRGGRKQRLRAHGSQGVCGEWIHHRRASRYFPERFSSLVPTWQVFQEETRGRGVCLAFVETLQRERIVSDARRAALTIQASTARVILIFSWYTDVRKLFLQLSKINVRKEKKHVLGI